MKLEVRMFNKTVIFTFAIRNRHREYQVGPTNKTNDGQYCVFLDYDKVPLDWIIDEITFLVRVFDLNRAHILETNNGYHVIATDKLPLSEFVQLLKNTSTDAAFRYVPLLMARKAWTLRGTRKEGQKPEYLLTIQGEGMNTESKAHNEYLRKHFNIPIPPLCEDESKEIIHNIYTLG